MKVKSLLCAALAFASLSASASYPIYFRDCVLGAADGGGNLYFPCEEGQEAEKAVSNGTPKFAEDGSITLTRKEDNGGCYFRTKKLTEPCPAEYTVLAMDYKTNRPVNDLVIFYHEFTNEFDQFTGALFTVSEDYQTCYVILNRNTQPKWGDDENYAKSYWWVSWNDANAHAEGFEFTVKNIRLLTIDEATEECKGITGDYKDAFSLPNTSLVKDYDDDLQSDIYSINPDGDGNGLLQTGNLIQPLPTTHTTFTFEYQLLGEDYTANVHMHKVANYTQMIGNVAKVTLEGSDDVDADSWKTATIDLADAIKANDFAQTFGSNHFLWIQFQGMSTESVLWARNPRWINPNAEDVEDPAGVAEIGVAERAADSRVFNIMGVEVKGELAPGLYIQNGKKFIVK